MRLHAPSALFKLRGVLWHVTEVDPAYVLEGRGGSLSVFPLLVFLVAASAPCKATDLALPSSLCLEGTDL